MQFIAKEFNELKVEELYEILKSRSQIFLMEQNIHYQDMDDIDYQSLHCFFMDHHRVVAYLRAFYDDRQNKIVKVGRVLTLNHGRGMGRELLEQSIEVIKEKMKCDKIMLDAQKHAQGFYEKLGFEVVSGEFIEEGIVHVVMELNLSC